MVTSTDDRQGEYKAICGRRNGKIQVAFERFRNAFATDNLSVCCCVKVYFFVAAVVVHILVVCV